MLVTPLLREGVPIGTINIRRTEVRPFSEKHVKLLETFADQAVIAIENVRLFQELQERTRELVGGRGGDEGAERSRAGGELDARSRNRAGNHRFARGRSVRDRLRGYLRIRRGRPRSLICGRATIWKPKRSRRLGQLG